MDPASDVFPCRDDKALAMARLEVMKGELRYTPVEMGGAGWEAIVEDPSGAAILKIADSHDVGAAIHRVYALWLPEQTALFRSLSARAAKFKVALGGTELEFKGVDEVPADRVVVYAHLYDSLSDLKYEAPHLRYSGLAWHLSLGADVVEAPNLRKISHRLDALQHKRCDEERESILKGAEEAPLPAKHPMLASAKSEGEWHPESVPELDRMPVPLGWRLLGHALVLLFGIFIGMLVGYLKWSIDP